MSATSSTEATSPKRLLIEHVTLYRYNQPVFFDSHRLMLMPQEDHNVSVLDFDLSCSPAAQLSWLQDVFGNSVAIAGFSTSASVLNITSRTVIEHRGADSLAIPLSQEALQLPVLYSELEHPDLWPSLAMRHPDEKSVLSDWLAEFVDAAGGNTADMLNRLNQAIHDRLVYRARYEPGIQSPAETLRVGSGTCRDYAVLMMESARALGLAARFVSGYLYDPSADSALQGAGSTHAWLQVYLPGPGWVEYDPTNALVNSRHLLRAAVARDPLQAVPVDGSYRGPSGAAQEMEITVTVRSLD